MNHQVKQRISKRVADYFVVVGAGENLKLAIDHETPTKKFASDHNHVSLSFQTDIIDRYPLEDRTDFPLPDGIQLFCLPNGLETCGPHPPTFHSFVHTSEHGAHIMGCCLTIYEPLTEQQKLSVQSYRKFPSSSSDSPIEVESEEELFFPLCLCLISHWPFVSSFKSFLCGLYRISVSKSKIPLERIICNFIDEVPSPPAGRVDITYYLGDEDHSQAISFRCPPNNQPNVWSSMPLFPLFECLSPDNVLSLFALLLTERQLIFVSSQYSLLTSCAEAVTSLMYPLSWTHAYIPILPRQLLGESSLQSLMSFRKLSIRSRFTILSCTALSCPVLRCPVLSCAVLSCPVLFFYLLLHQL
jgi:DENN (AEX-3) domain/uDENN domain